MAASKRHSLEANLARYAATHRQADADRAELFYQILLGRLDSWNVGGYREFLDSFPTSRQSYDDLRLLLLSMEAEFSDLSQVSSIPALLDALGAYSFMIKQMGAEATISAVTKAAAIRQTLTEKQTIQDYLIVTALISAAILIAPAGPCKTCRSGEPTGR